MNVTTGSFFQVLQHKLFLAHLNMSDVHVDLSSRRAMKEHDRFNDCRLVCCGEHGFGSWSILNRIRRWI